MARQMIVVVKGIVLCRGKALLVRRSGTDNIDPGVWECPGGKLEFGEGLEEGLQREVREEAGLSVSVDRLLYATSFFTSGNRQVIVLGYACTARDASVTLSEEHTDFRWVNRREMEATVGSAILRDFVAHRVLENLPGLEA